MPDDKLYALILTEQELRALWDFLTQHTGDPDNATLDKIGEQAGRLLEDLSHDRGIITILAEEQT